VTFPRTGPHDRELARPYPPSLGVATAVSPRRTPLGCAELLFVSMKLLDRLVARRQNKAHQRYLQERERQKALQGQDAQVAVRDVARAPIGTMQGPYGS
jgi:hypothetical protein